MNVSEFVRRRLKFRHLHVLLALDETLNVSRAAEKLNITQASVSRTLSEIEDGFGLTLFERHPRGLRRTGPGNDLIHAARKVVSNILALEDVSEQFSTLGRGEILVGLHNYSLLGQVASLMAGFKSRYPNVTIRLRDGLLPDLLDDLEYGRLDMVFGRLGPELDQTGFGTIPLARTQTVIVARAGVPPPPDDPVELVAQRWTIPLPGTPMRQDFDRFRAEHGLRQPADCIETNNATLITELLLQQDRYGLFPAFVGDQAPMAAGVQANPLLRSYCYPFKACHDRIGMIYSGSNAQTPAAAALIREMLADIPGQTGQG
ncbi:LysR family transcriptional regulator [Paracoccus sp. (in: a-proteobacteria)]|uniref:LysR family transcriptional regulator n=1 Tax=Paracoccus sp. TaxID=267 RepID=UPI003A85A072